MKKNKQQPKPQLHYKRSKGELEISGDAPDVKWVIRNDLIRNMVIVLLSIVLSFLWTWIRHLFMLILFVAAEGYLNFFYQVNAWEIFFFQLKNQLKGKNLLS